MLLIKQILLTILIFLNLHLFAVNQNFNTDSTKAAENYTEALTQYRNGNFFNAIELLNESLFYNIKLHGDKNENTGRIYNALGIVYKNIGDLDKSIQYYTLAEQSFLSSPDNYKNAISAIYNNIGNVYKAQLNYNTALEYYQRAINISKQQENIDIHGLADIYYSVAITEFALNNYNKTIEIIQEHIENSYPETELLFLSLQAAAYQELELDNKAYLSYQKAIKYASEYYSSNELNIIFEYINFATFLIDINNFQEAKSVLDKIAAIFAEENIEEGENLALYYRALGWYYENLNVETKNINTFREQKTKNLNKTILFYKNGLKALNFDISGLPEIANDATQSLSMSLTMEFINLIADVYVEIADVYDDKTDESYRQALNDALDYYSITSEMIQKARKNIYSDESKIQLNALQEETFYKIIQTTYKAYEIDNNQEIAEFAFHNAEQIKSSSVIDKLTDEVAKENSLIPDSLTQLEKNLNYQITSNNEKRYNLTLAEKPDSAAIAQTDSLLFELNKQREGLNTYLEENYSDYYDLKYSNDAVSIADIQKKLNNNEVLIEYVLNENDSAPELYSFFISPETSKFVKQDITSDFISSIETTFRFMSNSRFLFTKNKDSKEFCINAHHLYQKLISPFSASILDKKITIVPDGKLNYIAFEALLEELPDTTTQIQFAQLPYLIRKNTVNYSYSANLLFKFNQSRKNREKRVLAFAPEYKRDTVVFENEKLTLVPLPGVQREVDLIAGVIKTNLFKGADASEKNFRQHSKNYDILHLAMHAFINDSLPAYSRFAFAQNSSDEPENDGWLNTADIYNLDLNSRLTVLSACNTGSGSLKKGEGVISLARGFLYAGCPSIIMTHWEVEDNAGTEIMSSFYKNLEKGLRNDEALRLAKLEYLENANPRMAHPHYWLGYVSIGNPAPLFRSYDYYFFGLLVLAILAIATDQFIRLRKSRKT